MEFWCLQGFITKSLNGETWLVVMKLSKNEFCFGSPRWTDGQQYNADKLIDDSMPTQNEYDAKSAEFHIMQTSALKFVTGRGKEVTVEFASTGTPEKLMTTNDIKFARYPEWEVRLCHAFRFAAHTLLTHDLADLESCLWV